MNLLSLSEKGSEVRVINSDSISGLSSVGVNTESLAWSVAAPLPVRIEWELECLPVLEQAGEVVEFGRYVALASLEINVFLVG